MSFKKDFKAIIKEREETEGEDYIKLEQIWKKETNICTNNLKETIEYLKTECTASEFSWLSEIFNEIMEINPSKDFIDALYSLAKKYPEETEQYNIMSFINEAETYLDN